MSNNVPWSTSAIWVEAIMAHYMVGPGRETVMPIRGTWMGYIA